MLVLAAELFAGLGDFAAIFPDELENTAKTRLFWFGMCLASHMAGPRLVCQYGLIIRLIER
jgi:hypothetical protein